MKYGKDNKNWKGGVSIAYDGRIFVHKPNHPRAYKNNYVFRSILVAEKAIGKPLPDKAVVHHHNRIVTDDISGNLVICEDQSYHLLLHQRMRSLKACGHSSWRKCCRCKKYDSVSNLYCYRTKNRIGHFSHRSCESEYHKRLRRERKRK